MKKELVEKMQEEYADGIRAEDVLNNKAFIKAHEQVKNKALNDIISTKWFQHKLREEIYRRLKNESLVMQCLQTMAQNGKLAAKRLEK